MIETGIKTFNGGVDALKVLVPQGLLIAGLAVLLIVVVNRLQKENPLLQGFLKVVRLIIVIGAIGTFGWKVYSVTAPSPQEPVKKRLVLLEGEGEWR